MDLTLRPGPDGWRAALDDGRAFACAVGRGGVAGKRGEGDGITPVGSWPVRRVLYRPDRVAPPATALAVQPISPDDGWCDDPDDPAYNRPVTLPYPAGHETMWRDDRLYDLVVPLGFNDDPPVAGAGSVILLHVAAPDFRPTQGCIALAPEALHIVVECLNTASRVRVPDPTS